MKRTKKQDVKAILQLIEATATFVSSYQMADKCVLVFRCNKMTGYDGLSPIVTVLKNCGWNTAGEFSTFGDGDYRFRVAVNLDELPDKYKLEAKADA